MQVSDDKRSSACRLIILAAGASIRLGQPKQLLRYEGKTFIRRIAETALEVDTSPMIVLGANDTLIRSEIDGLPVEVVYNEGWKEGMASSVRVAITSVLEKNRAIDNVILIVCDQPFVSAEVLKNLLLTHGETIKGIVACVYADTIGTPVLFNKKYFGDLQSLQGTEGAKKIINIHAEDVATVPFSLGHVDIDTIEDYQLLLHNNIKN